MRLSDAIRLGAMMKPQAFGDVRDGVGTCAIGAAYEAVGVCLMTRDYSTVPQWMRLILDDQTRDICPACCLRTLDFGSVISHFNDWHRWTREQIADYVASLENASPVETPIAQDEEKDEEKSLETL